MDKKNSIKHQQLKHVAEQLLVATVEEQNEYGDILRNLFEFHLDKFIQDNDNTYALLRERVAYRQDNPNMHSKLANIEKTFMLKLFIYLDVLHSYEICSLVIHKCYDLIEPTIRRPRHVVSQFFLHFLVYLPYNKLKTLLDNEHHINYIQQYQIAARNFIYRNV